MPCIKYNLKAQQDLINIWKYIAKDYVSRANACLDTINKSLEGLADQPNMGRL